MFFDKKSSEFKALKNTVLLGAVLTPIAFMSLNGIFSQVDVQVDGIAHVSTLKQLERASSKSSTKEIKLDEDMDLSDWDGTPIAPTSGTKFDGQGHRMYNKNPDNFYKPLFSTSVHKIYNVVFDNTAFIMGSFSQSSFGITSRLEIPTLSDLQKNASVYDFENITFTNINTDLDFSNGPRGLLFDNYLMQESGQAYDDNALVLKDIAVTNSDIDINYKNIDNNTSFGLIGNLQYYVCGNSSHHHQGFVWMNDILISNNIINLNYSGSDQKEVSVSPVLGKFSGLSSWTGTGGNYLWINNIFLQQNEFISNQDNLTLNYGEIISQPLNATTNNQRTKISAMQNIISINNKVFVRKNEALKVEDNRVIAMENAGNNDVVLTGADSMFFIGDLYDSNKELNLFENSSASEAMHDITYANKLNSSNKGFRKLNNLLLDSLGIYNTFLATDKDNNLDEIKFAQKEDQVFVAPQSELGGDSETKTVTSFNLRFSFLKGYGEELNKDDIVTSAYQMKNIVITNSAGEVLFKMENSDDIVTTNADSSFLYEVQLVNKKGIKLEDINVDDLYVTFDYLDSDINKTRNNTKASHTTTVKINPDQLRNINVDKIVPPGGGAAVPVAIVAGTATGIILLILLLLLLLLLYRRYKLSKVVEMDDGYLEFVNQDDRNEDYEGYYSQNFDDNKYQEDYYQEQDYEYDQEYQEEYVDYDQDYEDDYDYSSLEDENYI